MGVGRETRLSAWIERFAAHFAEEGIPLIGGRILGYLLVCLPSERTAAELSQELEASSGSISTNLKFLVNEGLVTKRTRRGRQAAQYRINEKKWADLVQRKLDALISVRELTESGMRLLSGDPERALRLRTVDDLYTWLATELPAVWDRRPTSSR
ncbi:DNA-binding transcriptional regulator GbsR (MarR family) [Saccharothrix tamanrassetensis]|uniref:DNA-binding transcriptional regulator GbsR (MarR family) n=1 Tax=Saccharothrix tamanrassetensis TaxID=1051531 RepID=A0A841CUD3_9PSEU|nr:helix-turn-helix domain-containing protein [Saccharothrix tamanrassetensis]MBB5959036.1 DNA-binding transcriptional regulator GbsR (MarR family) [Saccharothrix tamanrassetensis]